MTNDEDWLLVIAGACGVLWVLCEIVVRGSSMGWW